MNKYLYNFLTTWSQYDLVYIHHDDNNKNNDSDDL